MNNEANDFARWRLKRTSESPAELATPIHHVEHAERDWATIVVSVGFAAALVAVWAGWLE